jgi:parallel beta-helix repeat protein
LVVRSAEKVIYPPIVSKSCQADILPAQSIAQKQQLHPYLEVTIIFIYSSARLLFNAAGMGVASLMLLNCYFDTAIAQTPTLQKQIHHSQTTISQVNALFVNPSAGDDKQGNGGESTPLKTITQALRVATPNTVIMLAKGTYSAATGEMFPLILKPSVSIQGNGSNKGRDMIISGGGDYLSRSFGNKNIAVVSAKGATLTGITVTNSNPGGYGLWIESTNFTVAENTFTGNTQDGVTVIGNSAPIIRNNFFYRNSANGITVTDASRAEIRENVFQETGFGINIAQTAQPVVVGNQIINNRSGIIVQASARPILRNNVIEGNKEDGLVALSQAQPDLGNTSEAGGNQFRNNARYDINASAAKQIITAYGNVIASDRIAGTVNTSGTIAAAENLPSPAIVKNSAQPTQVTQEITFSAPTVSTNTITTRTTSTRKLPPLPVLQSSQPLPPPPAVVSTNNSAVKPLNSQLLPLQSANSTSKVVATVTKPKQPTRPVTSGVVTNSSKPKPPTLRNATGFPIPSSLTAKQTATGWQQSSTPQVNYVQIATNTIEFVAPQPQSPINSATITPVKTGTNQIQPLPMLQPPPMGSNVPVGNQLPVSENPTTTAYAGSALGMRYRVIAEVQTQKDQELVRFLAPGAFPTFWQGRAVMQAGVFSSRYNAEQMLTILNNNGLRTMIESIGY